jgi:flavin reductase (DIM6/NTAB) family NADH-FMN oxidoreductase RutF
MNNRKIDTAELRKAFGCFLTGVTVVTTLDESEQPRGFTANSFTSVSLEPPLVLVCLGNRAGSYPVFAATRSFAVNILSETQRGLSNRFASKQRDRFHDTPWRTASTGSPLLDDAVAWLDCRTHRHIDAGDHLILLGEVVDLGHSPRAPLGFCRGNYIDFRLEQAAVAATPKGAARVGAILETRAKELLLVETAGGTLELPVGSMLGKDASETGSLAAVLASLGVDAEIEFLFSVFRDDRAGALAVYYRGQIVAGDVRGRAGAHLVALDAIPWERISDGAVKSMLQRYVDEQAIARFGIYVGSSGSGAVKALGPDD